MIGECGSPAQVGKDRPPHASAELLAASPEAERGFPEDILRHPVRASAGEPSANFFGGGEDVGGMESLLSDGQVLRGSVIEPPRFAVLYERHQQGVARYVTRRVGGEMAEDLTAEVFLHAFRGRARYRDEHGTALPWLLGIANNLIADHRKAERRRLDALQRAASVTVVVGEPSVGVLAPELVRELRQLPAVDRDTLLLVVWGELNYAEAATALKVPIGTIRSRIARARKRLARAIEPLAGGEEHVVNGEAHA